MQQRQLRLGDILDDYCPRERRVTNHAVVAMVGEDVKQTRCTTCDSEHDYKHAKVPRQRRKAETPSALYVPVAATGPKRVAHEPPPSNGSASGAASLAEHDEHGELGTDDAAPVSTDEHIEAAVSAAPADESIDPPDKDAEPEEDAEREHGPVHRPLIRASLPRSEGQQPPARPIPEFTIRQPGGRPGRFRPRNQRGGQPYQGNRTNGGNPNGLPRGMRPGGGRPQGGSMAPRLARRQGPPGRKRSK